MFIEKVNVPIYYFVENYIDYYGLPPFLLALPEKDYLKFIFTEALSLNATDITIYNTTADTADIFYNVRKRLVHSRRKISGDLVLSLAQLLASESGSAFDPSCEDPRFFSMRIDMHTRGRVVINKVYYGWCITIRVLPDEYLVATLEDLNLTPATCGFIRKFVLSDEKGLRLFIGETMSGKNTSCLLYTSDAADEL